MDPLFRLTGGVPLDAHIEDWFADRPGDLGHIARHWFERIRACGADVVELLHDGCPTACVEDAAFAYVNVFKSHVNVGFYAGAALSDPAGLLQGSGKRMRHVKVGPGHPDNEDALGQLIAEAYADISERVAASRSGRAQPTSEPEG